MALDFFLLLFFCPENVQRSSFSQPILPPQASCYLLVLHGAKKGKGKEEEISKWAFLLDGAEQKGTPPPLVRSEKYSSTCKLESHVLESSKEKTEMTTQMRWEKKQTFVPFTFFCATRQNRLRGSFACPSLLPPLLLLLLSLPTKKVFFGGTIWKLALQLGRRKGEREVRGVAPNDEGPKKSLLRPDFCNSGPRDQKRQEGRIRETRLL